MSNFIPVEDYYPFSPETLGSVDALYDEFARYSSYQAFLHAYGADETTKQLRPSTRHGQETHHYEVLDIRPDEHDSEKAMVVHLPMATPLDTNMKFQVASIAAAHPDTRVIAEANPSGPGRIHGTLANEQRDRLKRGDYSVLGENLAFYLDKENVVNTQEYGYSYGVDKALGGAALEATNISKFLLLEPVSAVERSLPSLGKSFKQSEKALQDYVEASGCELFEDAREDAIKALPYVAGLLRLSNLAIATTLADGKFKERLQGAMGNHSEAHATVAWGTASELADGSAIKDVLHDTGATHGMQRVSGMELFGHKHAVANHIGLQAALTLEAFRHGTD